MKLKESNFKSGVYGAVEEMEFTVDTSSSVIFDILRDKMYTNKIAAVCREVSSNSRDANIENGKSDVPIEIMVVEPFELDSISNKSIVFKDSGLGITPDRMADVFIKYAASTKRGSNDEVGGFGLGAKTPFAYSDTFTVITVCDVPEEETGVEKRMKFTYTAMIDDTQRGKMVLFDSEETEDETGTQIVVPFDDNDRYNFEKEIHRATSLWEVKLVLKGMYYDFEDLFVVIQDEDYQILYDKEQFFYSKVLLIIEGILYNLDGGLFPDNKIAHGISESYLIAVHFKTGEIEVSANREGVHYTKKVKATIAEKLAKVETQIESQIIEYIRVGDDYLESCIRVGEMVQANQY